MTKLLFLGLYYGDPAYGHARTDTCDVLPCCAQGVQHFLFTFTVDQLFEEVVDRETQLLDQS